LKASPEEDLLAATRRLVFSAVGHRLFRLYQQSDPALGKIIRGVKAAVLSSHGMYLERYGDELLICAAKDCANDPRPLLDTETLEIRLGNAVNSRASITTFVRELGRLLKRETVYRPSYPVIGFALVLRSIFSASGDREPDSLAAEDALSSEEIHRLIAASIGRVRTRMRPSYVGKQKMNESHYEVLLTVVEEILRLQFLSEDGVRTSYYDSLRARIPRIKQEEYQRSYRAVLEYLCKLARQELVHQVQAELQ
jgi:hypothetical protein